MFLQRVLSVPRTLTPPHGDIRMCLDQIPEPLPPILSLWIATPHPLHLQSHSSGHYSHLVTIDEGWNADWPVNWELPLLSPRRTGSFLSTAAAALICQSVSCFPPYVHNSFVVSTVCQIFIVWVMKTFRISLLIRLFSLLHQFRYSQWNQISKSLWESWDEEENLPVAVLPSPVTLLWQILPVSIP